jgi:type I restriction enzyme, S subunit
MADWKEYKLDAVYEFASGLSKGREEFGFGFGFLAYKDVFNNYFLPDDLTTLVNASVKERETCSIKRGDVFLTRTSETEEELGLSSVALKDYPDATFNGFTKRLRPKGTVEILPEYAGFYFRSPKFRAVVSNMASITTRASLNNEMLAALSIIVPPLPEQHAIADILSSLDDKIDLLHRQNKTLEALAETLFRQWFIEEAEESWEDKAVSEIVDVRDGTHDSPKQKESGFHLITSKHLKPTGIDFSSAYKISKEDFISINKRSKVNKNDILFSMIGTLGLIHFVEEEPDFAIKNIGLFKSSQKPAFAKFLYLLLKSPLGDRFIYESADGSTQEYISLGSLRQIRFKYPGDLAINQFDETIQPYFEKILLNNKQIRSLTTLRDTLLPKLMSGEVRVNH